MKKMVYPTAMAAMMLLTSVPCLIAQQPVAAKAILDQKFNLVPPRSADTQYYELESHLQRHALDGTIQQRDVYRLYLRCVPSARAQGKDEYTCLKFTVQLNKAAAVSIPSLAGWKYLFSLGPDTAGEKGPLLGIDHGPFEKLADDSGKPLPVENAFHVYNAFIDFHTMSVFAEKTARDSGVQDLKRIGDKIIHEASYSQPAVNLGTRVAEGSYFKNGKITLEFKGLAIINGKSSALLGYDSGESSFYVLIKPMANMEVKTKGSSHYQGDIYKDLATGWIQKAVLHEVVISETTVPGTPNKVHAVIERSITIKNVQRFHF